MDRKFVTTALGYAILGLLLGIFMAMSHNHSQLVTHAHILLIGFVVSFVYAVCHKLWLTGLVSKLVRIQYYAHQIGTLLLVVGLFLMYGGLVAEAILGPILGIGSLLVLSGMIMMKVMFIRSKPKTL
ncbi:TonB-dependent receptor [Neptunicella sp. SCSIO 80796]|uniref:TonB-dependent receptor n=1 Tax=Neptunicella plasticusilytica TaxID=3117012 RepID=UPI003A4D58AA